MSKSIGEVQIHVRKGRAGWEATTDIDLEAPYMIRIHTLKGSRGLTTLVNRYKKDGSGCISFEMFGDFSERTVTGDRCTEKNVLAQHTKALADIEEIKARCVAFYAAKEERRAA